MLCQKSLHESCRMGMRIVVMKLICSLGHFECDGHTVHKLNQRHITADWLAPRESDCSWMRSKVSSDRLPSYIKVTWPLLEIFKMDGHFLDSQCTAEQVVFVMESTVFLWGGSSGFFFRIVFGSRSQHHRECKRRGRNCPKLHERCIGRTNVKRDLSEGRGN